LAGTTLRVKIDEWTSFNGSLFTQYTTTGTGATGFSSTNFLKLTVTNLATNIHSFPVVGLTCIGTSGSRVYQFYNVNGTVAASGTTYSDLSYTVNPNPSLPVLGISATNITFNKATGSGSALLPYYALNLYNI